MTTATIKKGDLVPVTATVGLKTQPDANGLVKVDLNDTGIGNYPVKITVSTETALAMQSGLQMTLTLIRENLRPNKDPSIPYNYYYGLHALGETTPTPAPIPAPTGRDGASRGAYVSDRERHDAIQWDVRLKLAGDLVIAYPADEPLDDDALADRVLTLAALLSSMPSPKQESENPFADADEELPFDPEGGPPDGY